MAQRLFTLVGASLGAMLLIAAGAAYAGTGSGDAARSHDLMKHADSDKDGGISLQEIQALKDKPFSRFDRDGDGTLTEPEVRATIEEQIDRMVEQVVHRFDADRDGMITRDEFSRFARERFSWLDLNDDGEISEGELPRFVRRLFQ